MWFNIFIGSILIVFSILVNASTTRFVMRLATKKAIYKNDNIRNKEIWISIIVLIMFAASFLLFLY